MFAFAQIYVALFPCNECAKLIIQSGIAEVVFLEDKYHDKPPDIASRRLLTAAGVRIRRYVPSTPEVVIRFPSVPSIVRSSDPV